MNKNVKKLLGKRFISGSWGELWWDGEKILEISKFEAKVTTEREDVNQGGTLDVDSKLVGLKGEGSFTIKKVYSRTLKKLIESWKQGIDPRSKLITKLHDPDSFGSERALFNNVWFIDGTIMNFESKKLVEEELKFGFTPSDVEFQELIA